jgi:PAS domain S-box-containing protein
MQYSARAREIYGFTADQDVTINDVREATHPDDLPRTSALAARALDPVIREKPVYEFRLKCRDGGGERWALAHGEALFDADEAGQLSAARYIGTIEDITDSKALEAAYSDAQMTQRLAIDAARMAVWEFDIKTQKVRGSPELNRLYGFESGSEPTIEELRQCYLPGEQERVQQAALAALEQSEMEFEVEFRILRKDGADRWMLLRAQIITDADGEYDRVVGVVMDIDERKRGEQQRELMVRELNHRVKNSLSVVLAIASQTFRGAVDMPTALNAFRGRVQALAVANDVIVENDWGGFELSELIDRVTAPYRQEDSDPFTIHGQQLTLAPTANVPLALALHELCTNAAKYGALSVPGGRIDLTWTIEGACAQIVWKEMGGPVVKEGNGGFGTTMMRRILSQEFEQFDLQMPSSGVICTIRIRLEVLPSADERLDQL